MVPFLLRILGKMRKLGGPLAIVSVTFQALVVAYVVYMTYTSPSTEAQRTADIQAILEQLVGPDPSDKNH